MEAAAVRDSRDYLVTSGRNKPGWKRSIHWWVAQRISKSNDGNFYAMQWLVAAARAIPACSFLGDTIGNNLELPHEQACFKNLKVKMLSEKDLFGLLCIMNVNFPRPVIDSDLSQKRFYGTLQCRFQSNPAWSLL